MKRSRAVRITAVISIILLCASVFLALGFFRERTVEYDFARDVNSVLGYKSLLRVAGSDNFPPFCYMDKNGLPCGHDVELIFELCRTMGYHIDLTLCPPEEALAGLTDGKYDVVLASDYSVGSKAAATTSPISVDRYAMFARRGSETSDSVNALSNYRIAVKRYSSELNNFIVPMGLVNNIVPYDTTREALESVANGQCDIAIASYYNAEQIIAAEGLPLVQSGNSLAETAYCLLYGKNNNLLGQKLDSAVAKLRGSGKLEALNKKWFEEFSPALTFGEYLTKDSRFTFTFALLIIMLILMAVALVQEHGRKRELMLLKYDKLTGLPNIATFCELVSAAVRDTPDKDLVICQMDIDNFKEFNSIYSHVTGDRLLKSFGEALSSKDSMPEGTIAAGYGGADHFLLLGDREYYIDYTRRLYNTLLSMLREIIPDYSFSISMGFCDIPANPKADFISYCDKAMIAQRSIKGSYDVSWASYDKAIQQKLSAESEIVSSMRDALSDGQFRPYFQPQFDYLSGKIIGAETLVRWVHPGKGLISPSKFVPVFERNGFIYEMDKCVWRSACQCLGSWRKMGIQFPHISVNISRADLYHTDLAETISSIVSESGLSPEDIHLEITESAYMQNPMLLSKTIEELHDRGFFIEMDDFGSGYSSLTSLKDLSFDLVKLDMGFLSDNDSKSDKAGIILSETIHMLHLAGLPLIAEGVETKEHAEFLKSVGCRYMQGYLFSKPVSRESLEYCLLSGRCSIESFSEAASETKKVDFLDVRTQEALLFNSFVGGAAILEYRDGKVIPVRCNDKYFSELGIPREVVKDFVNTDLLSLLEEGTDVSLRKALESSAETGEEAECETRYTDAFTGKKCWCLCHVRYLSSKFSSRIYYTNVFDITELRRLEIANKELNNDLFNILDSLDVGVARYSCTDGNDRVDFMSRRFAELRGYTVEEFCEKVKNEPGFYIVPEERQKVMGIFHQMHLENRSGEVRFRSLCKDGSAIDVYSKVTYDPKNNRAYVILEKT